MNNKDNLFGGLEWDSASTQILGQGIFLRITQDRVRNRLGNGQKGPWYQVEAAHTPFHDAVVLVLYGVDESNKVLVGLRHNVRPATALRSLLPSLVELDGGRVFNGGLWELPAGGVEQEDMIAPSGPLVSCACRETWEEMGLQLTPQDFFSLGPGPFASPSFSLERLHYLAASVDPSKAQTPPGDGHPMEQAASSRFVPLAQALSWCQEGRIVDLKTEVGLRRLADHLAAQDKSA